MRVADEDQISKIIYNLIFCVHSSYWKKDGLYVWISLYDKSGSSFALLKEVVSTISHFSHLE